MGLDGSLFFYQCVEQKLNSSNIGMLLVHLSIQRASPETENAHGEF
jgi:hypothetical protein